MAYLELLAGFVLLVVGGEILVRNSVSVARRLGVSPLLIGLTLVGFGTSTPELVTSLQAALAGAPGIAIGNVLGSNIANILFILGMAAFIHPIVQTDAPGYDRDAIALIASAVAGGGLILSGHIGRISGVMLLLALVFYIVRTYQAESRATASQTHTVPGGPVLKNSDRINSENIGHLPTNEGRAGLRRSRDMPAWAGTLLALAGIAITIFGAGLMVEGSVSIARHMGLSESIIGLTIVAIGTSLPEMTTSVLAALRKEPGIAIGNIIGSNIYNILGILGLTALISPISIPADIGLMDVTLMLASTLALCWFGFGGWRISRREGLALLAAYAGYVLCLGLAATA